MDPLQSELETIQIQCRIEREPKPIERKTYSPYEIISEFLVSPSKELQLPCVIEDIEQQKTKDEEDLQNKKYKK